MSRKPACSVSVTAPAPAEADPFDAIERHVDAVDQATTGLQPLAAEKRATTARGVGTLVEPARALCAVLTTAPSDPAKVPRHKRLVGAFDVIAAHDGGDDPERFEPEAISAKLDRAARATALADRLDGLARRLRDDALRTTESVSRPITMALDLARTLARGDFADELVPVTDALAALTAKARRAPKAEPATEPEADADAE
ncbi:MAG: hypothetical protein R3A52_05580 [Polyangiales bacterium]